MLSLIHVNSFVSNSEPGRQAAELMYSQLTFMLNYMLKCTRVGNQLYNSHFLLSNTLIASVHYGMTCLLHVILSQFKFLSMSKRSVVVGGGPIYEVERNC